ncbi:hypothetical protein LB505_011589 [Fusarium chuoi]|nr:hypothetical protein LB505_011589 [Fusarium chuoi]
MVLSQKYKPDKYNTEPFSSSWHSILCTILLYTTTLYTSALYIVTLYIHTDDLLTTPCTRSQKRKAEESEPQDQAPTSAGRPTKIVLVKGVRGGNRLKVARDDDDRLTVPAPPATVYRHSKLKKVIIRKKSSTNHSMYFMVIPVVFRGVQAQESDEKPIPFNFRCVIRSKCPYPEQNILPTQQPAPGAVEKKRIAPTLVKAGELPA